MEGTLSQAEREELRSLAEGDPALEELVGGAVTPYTPPERDPALERRIDQSRAVEAADPGSVALRKMGVSMMVVGLLLSPVIPLAPFVVVAGSSLIIGPWLGARFRNHDPYNKVDQ